MKLSLRLPQRSARKVASPFRRIPIAWAESSRGSQVPVTVISLGARRLPRLASRKPVLRRRPEMEMVESGFVE